MGNSFEKRDFKWDWLNDVDADPEDVADYRELDDEPTGDSDPLPFIDDDDTGAVAGCAAWSAVIAAAVFLVWLLSKGGAW